MWLGEEYDDFFRREEVWCCKMIPMPLPHIPIKVIKRKGHASHNSHYFDYAFECLKCGAVYEVIVEDYSYTSIGDFMQRNYTSWSVRPALRYIENHSIEALKLIKEEYFKQSEALDKLIRKQKEKLDKKIDKLEKITGNLDDEQIYNVGRELGQAELKSIKEYKEQQKDLKRTYIENIRNTLNLPPISNKYRDDGINQYYKAKELKEKLKVKQKQLSSVKELVSKIDSKNILLKEIATIEKDIKSLKDPVTRL